MNIQLEKLLKNHDIPLQDRHDFMQIYSLLPTHKKVRVIENFESIISNIQKLREEMLVEQKILFGNTLSSIEEKLKTLHKRKINSGSRESIALLKNSI